MPWIIPLIASIVVGAVSANKQAQIQKKAAKRQESIALQQAAADARQAESEAQLHEYNASVSRAAIHAEHTATQAELLQQERIAGQYAKKRRAAVGASGVQMSGSPLMVMEDELDQFELDRFNITEGARTRADALYSQVKLDEMKAKMTRQTGVHLEQGGKMVAAAYGSAAKDYRTMGLLNVGTIVAGGIADISYKNKMLNGGGTNSLLSTNKSKNVLPSGLYRTH